MLGRFVGRRWWILLHVSSGSIALVLATVLLWRISLERDQAVASLLRAAYFSGVAVSCVPGMYLAIMLEGEVGYAAGLTGLAVAWAVTTGLSGWTMIRGRAMQHNRWLLRSCTVTFAFVFFRGMVVLMSGFGFGSMSNRLRLASWACWILPLCTTEGLIWRKRLLKRDSERD